MVERIVAIALTLAAFPSALFVFFGYAFCADSYSCGGTRLFIVVAVLIAYAVGVIAMNAAVWSGHRSRWWWVGGVGALVVIAPLVT